MIAVVDMEATPGQMRALVTGAEQILAERVPVQHPGKRRSVMPCRCGRMLDAADMQWAPPLHDEQLLAGGGLLPRVVCPRCANRSW